MQIPFTFFSCESVSQKPENLVICPHKLLVLECFNFFLFDHERTRYSLEINSNLPVLQPLGYAVFVDVEKGNKINNDK